MTRRHSQYGWTMRTLPVLIGAALLPASAIADGPFKDDFGHRHENATIGVPKDGEGFRRGVVATTEALPAQEAAKVLHRGGNAFDAAAVAQFLLNVVEPQSSGIGGGLFMTLHLARKDEAITVDAREETPGAGTPTMFVTDPDAEALEPFPFDIRSTSGIAVGVPGTLASWAAVLERYGTISLAEALEPAIRAAENGIVVSSRLAESTESSRLQSECDDNPDNSPFDIARSVYRPGGDPAACGTALEEGDLLVQPDLAHTFRLIAEEGLPAFYDCDSPSGIAQAIIETQMAARSVDDPEEHERLRGRMTCEDLAAYEVFLREPIAGDYRGFTVKSMPPPSSGGLTVIETLKILETFPIGDESQGFGFGDFKTLNVMLEAMRLAFADRAVWIGDTDVVPDLPVDGLIDDDYVATRAELIEVGARQTGIEAGDPRPFDEDVPAPPVQITPPLTEDEEGRNTTHFVVVDKWRNVVSVTSTIESGWGTGLMVPGFGFLLNNELTDFNSVPTFNPDPDNFNPGANDPAPFKRPRSSMAPTIVYDHGKPVAAYGSPGGSSIINTVVNMTLNLVDHDFAVQEAIDKPRVSLTTASDDGTASIEEGFEDDVVTELEALGYGLEVTEIGSVQAAILGRKRLVFGGADPRRIGTVVGIGPKRKM
jgi:gamma-glutamyltranspeptidase / glutathione hydrolase